MGDRFLDVLGDVRRHSVVGRGIVELLELKPKKGEAEANESEAPETPPVPPVDLAKSQAVLSKLKEMEFHSRANIETLAGLTLEIEEELKQKDFSGPIGDLYSAQDQFQTKILALIESYEGHVGTMKE
jgi:hypothetical protein